MRDEIAVIALSVLDQSKDRSNQDECTATIEGVEMFLPGVGADHAAAGRYLVHAHVEGDADNDEKTEEEDLNHETTDGDVFAIFERLKCTRSHDASSCSLQTKTDDIANNEDLCEPSLGDDTVSFAVGEENDASEFHVYAGSEEGRSDEDQDGLNRVGRNAEVRSFLARYVSLDDRNEYWKHGQ